MFKKLFFSEEAIASFNPESEQFIRRYQKWRRGTYAIAVVSALSIWLFQYLAISFMDQWLFGKSEEFLLNTVLILMLLLTMSATIVAATTGGTGSRFIEIALKTLFLILVFWFTKRSLDLTADQLRTISLLYVHFSVAVLAALLAIGFGVWAYHGLNYTLGGGESFEFHVSQIQSDLKNPSSMRHKHCVQWNKVKNEYAILKDLIKKEEGVSNETPIIKKQVRL